jgi:hypothetical protein
LTTQSRLGQVISVYCFWRPQPGRSVQKRKAAQRPPHLQVFGDRLRAGFHFFNYDDVAAALGAIRG